MHDPFVGAVRSDMFRAGEICELPGVKIEVVAVREGGFPTVLRFSFTEGSLDEGTSRFATWQDHRFAEVNVPAVGSTIELPALDFAKELAFRP